MEYALKQDRKLSLRQHYLDQVPPDYHRITVKLTRFLSFRP